ncbi:outer membrane lipoprotein carrier protein LolA [Bacteroidota bacterium]
MKIKKIVLTLVIFISMGLYPQNATSNLLGKLQAKFDSVESFSIDFIQFNNAEENLSGVFSFKKENNIKIVTDKLIITSNGVTSWNYNKAENKVIISNVDESDPGIFSINKIVYEFPEECDVSFGNDENEEVIKLTPNGYKYNFDSIWLWLNDEDLISQVLINNSAMGNIGVTFLNYNLNMDLPDSEFNFVPPEGSKIIDIR